ncbi:4-hydroxyacetophenone monooxygenase, partial [Nocardia sp. NPDC058497]
YNLYTGRDGRTVSEAADAEGYQMYKGTTVANFPNMFFMLGANSGLNYTSLIYAIESQINYVVDAVKTMQARELQTFEAKLDVQRDYNEALAPKMARTVWVTGGCTSWFLDKHGKSPALWPDFSFRFRKLVRRFDIEAYDTTAKSR